MRRLSIIGLALLMAGCVGVNNGSPGPTSKSSPGASRAPTASPAAGEIGEDLGPFACGFPHSFQGSTDRAQISSIVSGPHPGFDRMVFEFQGLGALAVPSIDFKVASSPFAQDPSGLPLEVSGKSFIVMSMHASTVDANGQPTYTGTKDFTPGLPTLQELALAGDFEALSTWIIGLSHPACVRITAFESPNRLVIDMGK